LSQRIEGNAKDNVRPSLLLDKGTNWNVFVYFAGPVQDEWWLGVVSNRIGCQLRLWETNGVEVHPSNSEVAAASQVAAHPIVASLLDSIRNHRGSDLGMWRRLLILPDAVIEVYRYSLGDLFPIASDREYTLEVAPMLYRVNIDKEKLKSNDIHTDRLTADLVKFPPLYLKLLTNGTVVSLDETNISTKSR
jgi:hypothetical protein